MFLRKFFNWLFNNTNVPKNEEAAMPAAWPFPMSDHFEQAVEVTTPKVARKHKATTTKKKAKAKATANPKATNTKKATPKKPSK